MSSPQFPRNVTKFDLYPISSGTFQSLLGGLVELAYYESILDLTVRVSATFADTGSGGKSLIEDLVAGNKCDIKMSDEKGNKIDFTNTRSLRLKQSRNMIQDTSKSSYVLDLYCKDFITNQVDSALVLKRYSGRISDTIESIMKTDYIKSSFPLLIDETTNSLEVIGNRRKPFSVISELATKSVAENAPGYLFYQTYDGYNFRSIDRLFSQDPKRKLIFNNTSDMPSGYDAKILEYSFDIGVDLDKKIESGSIGKSKLISFDFYENVYEGELDNENEFDADSQFSDKFSGGKEPLKFPTDLGLDKTKTYTRLKDIGINPAGGNATNQLEKSKEVDFDINNIVRQATVRYNSLFNIKLSITIDGDLGLRAGDMLYCDFPELNEDQVKISRRKSGLYMIVDIATLINPEGIFTRLNLVRDSEGRKPSR